MSKKKILLNTIFAVLIVTTIVWCVAGFIDTNNEIASAEEGIERFVASLGYVMMLAVTLPVFAAELNAYQALRYFIFCKERQRYKTVINGIGLALSAAIILLLIFAIASQVFIREAVEWPTFNPNDLLLLPWFPFFGIIILRAVHFVMFLWNEV